MKLADYSIEEKKALLESIAKRVKFEYDFNDYEIKPDKIKEISELIFNISLKYHLSEITINYFFIFLHEGKFGTLYKMPSDLIGKFWKYIDENKNPYAHLKQLK